MPNAWAKSVRPPINIGSRRPRRHIEGLGVPYIVRGYEGWCQLASIHLLLYNVAIAHMRLTGGPSDITRRV